MKKQLAENLYEYTLKNEHLEVKFLNIGGAITKIALAEDNFSENLVLAYDDPLQYLDNSMFLNTLIGRTSNRIKDGKFDLLGRTIQLDLNDGPNNLHGGVDNLTHKNFEVLEHPGGYLLKARLDHQESGFPGNLDIQVAYVLEGSGLVVSYEAVTDQPTIANLTHHAYFNLSGNLKTDVADHQVEIGADFIAEIDGTSAFTENLLPVGVTRFDFNDMRPIVAPHYEGGYDHLYVLNGKNPAAIVWDPASGRKLTVTTTEPAMQFYSGNYIDESTTFENGRIGEIYLGACLETHKIPYDYASQQLNPGETYRQETRFEFTKGDPVTE
ncbi:MAG: galactose mutarotase [Turicibacter sp.]|nr:galactose mutarotase [Turicibacter sp.]